MPMRFLIYAGQLYAKYVETDPDYNIYSSCLQQSPAPRCICFYNGEAEKDDRIILKLTSGFKKDGDIEVTSL